MLTDMDTWSRSHQRHSDQQGWRRNHMTLSYDLIWCYLASNASSLTYPLWKNAYPSLAQSIWSLHKKETIFWFRSKSSNRRFCWEISQERMCHKSLAPLCARPWDSRPWCAIAIDRTNREGWVPFDVLERGTIRIEAPKTAQLLLDARPRHIQLPPDTYRPTDNLLSQALNSLLSRWSCLKLRSLAPWQNWVRIASHMIPNIHPNSNETTIGRLRKYG